MKNRISLFALVFLITCINAKKVFSQTGQHEKNVESKEVIEYYENGKVKAKWTYNGKIKNGSFKMFHPNGQVWSIGTYINNLPSGVIKIYDYDGNLVKEEVWDNGICKKQTKFKEWEPDGTIHTEIQNGESVEFIWEGGKKIRQK